MEFERHRVEQQEVKKSSLLPIIGASLLVHMALGAWIFYSPVGHKITSENVETKPIEAKLVFVDLETFQPPPSNDSEPSETIEEPPIAEPLEISQPEDIVETQVETVIEAPSEQTPEEIAETQPVEDVRDNLPALDMPEDIDQADTQTDDLVFSGQVGSGISRDLARRHLQNYQNQAVERLTAQRARQYQQQKASPDLQIPEFDNFTTEDEKFHQERSVRVDCSSTLNKTLSVISGITGGGLKCSEGADLTPYIKKHLNKGTPASQQNNQN